MDRSRWPQIESVFKEALTIDDEADRASFVRQQCRDDTELQREVEALVASHLEGLRNRDVDHAAVVVVEVRGRTGPGEQYQPSHKRIGMEDQAHIFPPGTEVQIVDDSRDAWSEKDWFEAELLDGSRTFLPTATVERVFREGS